MRILYVAPDQVVPGTLGGSVHVQAVAEGLAACGHEVHVAATPGGAFPPGPVHWHALRPPLGQRHLRWLRTSTMTALARDLRAELVMERYHNFGGEGVLAARQLGLPAVLEVNAPIIDFPRSAKSRLDRALLVEPMRRWRDRLCRATSLFVTPTAAILPPWVPPDRVLEIEWGADTSRFHPGAAPPAAITRPGRPIVSVFSGAFRPWHGARQLAEALARLRERGEDRFGAIFVGDGPERAATERAAAGLSGVSFLGARPHSEMPGILALADVGVAPFDPARHAALSLGFYWSPLKVFEYMATGLPVVAPNLPRLAQLVGSGREGVLYDQADPAGLETALLSLADVAVRRALGSAARARVVEAFSWQAHVAALDARLRELVPS